MLNSKETLDKKISKAIEKIKDIGGDRVRFIILFGSLVKRKLTPLSDIDIAVFYNGDKKERFEFRIKILGRVSNDFDIQIFQDLPLYIQKDIISTGKVVYYSDYQEIFDVFLRTIREFEDFRPRLELYYSKLGV